MSIMDVFRGFAGSSGNTSVAPAPAPAPAPAAPTPGNIPPNASANGATVSTPGTAPNGVVPGGHGSDATPNPLDNFKDLFTPPKPDEVPGNTPLFQNFSQEDLLKAAQAVDFKSAITKEQLTAIAAGGEGAVEAFAQAINSVGQHVFAHSAHAATKLVERAMTTNNQNLEAKLPSMLKSHALSDNLRTQNPALSHPAAAPIVGAIQASLAQKYPNATQAELQEMATTYLSNFATAVNPQKTEPTNGKPGSKGKDENWDEWLQ